MGQYTHLGSWNILNIRYDIGDKWSVFAEGQVRSLHFYDWFHYHEYKAGIIWHNRPGMHIALGMGDYDTYKEGGDFVTPKNNDEFRLWPQLTFDQKLGKVKMETRYRAELRFQESGFRERFRQRILFSLPLASKTSVSFSNEIFLPPENLILRETEWPSTSIKNSVHHFPSCWAISINLTTESTMRQAEIFCKLVVILC
ncbi:MAG: DUF2490 domain-containing protein [Saprospiraceae bacterium]|nr:DUF2490 domain-containing protein [Saprospiraceae bacterium]